MTENHVKMLLLCSGLLATISCSRQPGVETPLDGAWDAELYTLASGSVHTVTGRIFFSQTQWQVLFFVMREGRARRGSAEGGGYTIRGDSLILTHLFNLSAGGELPGLAASELNMISRDPADASTEPTRFEVLGDQLTLFFPSGNSMMFRRQIRRRRPK